MAKKLINLSLVMMLTVVAMMYFIPCYALSLLAQRLEQGPEGRAQRLAVEVGADPTATVATS